MLEESCFASRDAVQPSPEVFDFHEGYNSVVSGHETTHVNHEIERVKLSDSDSMATDCTQNNSAAVATYKPLSGIRDQQGLFLRPASSGKGLLERFSFKMPTKPFVHIHHISSCPTDATKQSIVKTQGVKSRRQTGITSISFIPKNDHLTNSNSSCETIGGKNIASEASRRKDEDAHKAAEKIQCQQDANSVEKPHHAILSRRSGCADDVRSDIQVSEDQDHQKSISRDETDRHEISGHTWSKDTTREAGNKRSDAGLKDERRFRSRDHFQSQDGAEIHTRTSNDVSPGAIYSNILSVVPNNQLEHASSHSSIEIGEVESGIKAYRARDDIGPISESSSNTVQKTGQKQRNPSLKPKVPQNTSPSASISDIMKILQHKIAREHDQATKAAEEGRTELLIELQKIQEQYEQTKKGCEQLKRQNSAISLEIAQKNELLLKYKSKIGNLQKHIGGLGNDIDTLCRDQKALQKEAIDTRQEYDMLRTTTTDLRARISNAEQLNKELTLKLKQMQDEISMQARRMLQGQETHEKVLQEKLTMMANRIENFNKRDEIFREWRTANTDMRVEIKLNQERLLDQLMVLETFVASLEPADAAKEKHNEQVTRLRELEITNTKTQDGVLKGNLALSCMAPNVIKGIEQVMKSNDKIDAAKQEIVTILKADSESLRSDLVRERTAQVDERRLNDLRTALECQTAAKDVAMARLSEERIQWKTIQENFEVAIAEAAEIRKSLEKKISESAKDILTMNSPRTGDAIDAEASRDGDPAGSKSFHEHNKGGILLQTVSEATAGSAGTVLCRTKRRGTELQGPEANKRNRYDSSDVPNPRQGKCTDSSAPQHTTNKRKAKK